MWLSTANDPLNDAVPHNPPGVRIHQLENPALYSRGRIVRANMADTLIRWEDSGGGPVSTETYSLLALATLISATPALGWKGRADDANQDLADMQAFMFGTDDCFADANHGLCGVAPSKAKKPVHYNQDRYFYEMMEQTTPKDKKDTVTFRQMTLLMIMGLAKVRIPRRNNQPMPSINTSKLG